MQPHTYYMQCLLYFRKYDVRIAPCFDSVVEQYCDAEVHKIVDHFKSTIHRRYINKAIILWKLNVLHDAVREERSILCIIPMALMVTLGLMVHCWWKSEDPTTEWCSCDRRCKPSTDGGQTKNGYLLYTTYKSLKSLMVRLKSGHWMRKWHSNSRSQKQKLRYVMHH